MSTCRGCGVTFPPDGGSGKYGYCLACREGISGRQRLTQAEWDAELARAADVQAKDVERFVSRPGRRRRSWWQRGWRR